MSAARNGAECQLGAGWPNPPSDIVRATEAPIRLRESLLQNGNAMLSGSIRTGRDHGRDWLRLLMLLLRLFGHLAKLRYGSDMSPTAPSFLLALRRVCCLSAGIRAFRHMRLSYFAP